MAHCQFLSIFEAQENKKKSTINHCQLKSGLKNTKDPIETCLERRNYFDLTFCHLSRWNRRSKVINFIIFVTYNKALFCFVIKHFAMVELNFNDLEPFLINFHVRLIYLHQN